MNINTVMSALEEAEKIHKEQQAFWDTFEEIWPVQERIEKEKCLHDEVDDFIIDKIASALKECNHNRTHTADKLGIKRETLLAKMKKYCLL
jgi:transcriptional regulator with PAS, ATPase and Fis domain